MTTMTWVFLFRCPLCGESIVLPRQSPLGKYEGQQYLTTPMWPITFLCKKHGQSCECSVDKIDLEPIQRPDPPPHWETLWEIEAECVHGNCGLRHVIYAKYSPDGTSASVVQSFLATSARVPCTGDHDAEFRTGKIRAKALEF
jgi:hypothetical protein